MSLSKRDRERLLNKHCGVINDDDAIDPRHYFYNKRKPNKKFRKAFQLCRQVFDTLRLSLTDGPSDLEGLSVIEVLPAPDSRRMLVIVEIAPGTLENASASEIEAIMACLQSQRPRLRAEIARTINRRKTPDLIFELAKFRPSP